MSVLVVSSNHIAALLNAAMWDARSPMIVSTTRTGLGRIAPDTAHAWGQYLLDENVLAFGDDKYRPVYGHNLTTQRGPVETLRLLESYEYQVDGLPDYRHRDVRKFCDALRHRLISRIPGYQDAPSMLY